MIVTKSNILKKNLIEALEASLGIVTTACKKVGCSRKTFYQYYKEDAEFKKQVDDIGNIALDFAESKLHNLIKNENPISIIFYLKTKGKKRGYIEKQEFDIGGQKENPLLLDIADKLKKHINEINTD